MQQTVHGGLPFDEMVAKAPEPFRMALVNVCDTADMCRRWLAEAGLAPTAADVVALTRLVLDEAERHRAEDHTTQGDDLRRLISD